MIKLAKLLLIGAVAAAALSGAAQAQAQAQTFPTKAVRILTPFPAGAGPEAVLRVLAEKLQKKGGANPSSSRTSRGPMASSRSMPSSAAPAMATT